MSFKTNVLLVDNTFRNAAFGTCSALTRFTLPVFFQDEVVENQIIPQIRAMMEEILAVGRAMGFSEEALPSSIIDDTITVTARLHKAPDSIHKASILLDLESGRPMELEVLLGELVRKAKELGVDAPVSFFLCPPQGVRQRRQKPCAVPILVVPWLTLETISEIRNGLFSVIRRTTSTVPTLKTFEIHHESIINVHESAIR